MRDTTDFWSGAFGSDYTKRNRVDWRQRQPFWQSAIEYMHPASVLEVGANAGWNLMALQACDSSIDLAGIDVNQTAVNEARANGLEVQLCDAMGLRGLHQSGSFDLVFTAGVLIHVPPTDLLPVMALIRDTSAKYVLAVEYAADEETEVEYRGHAGKLWKRPFGKLYQDLGLQLVAEVEGAEGFDNCTAWLLEKRT